MIRKLYKIMKVNKKKFFSILSYKNKYFFHFLIEIKIEYIFKKKYNLYFFEKKLKKN